MIRWFRPSTSFRTLSPDGTKKGPTEAKTRTWGPVLIQKKQEVRQNRCPGSENSKNIDFAKTLKTFVLRWFFIFFGVPRNQFSWKSSEIVRKLLGI